jgi:hypothetical protein
MNDLLLEISPYDGYKIANAKEGDIVIHQTNSNNAIIIGAKPKGLSTLSLSSSNVTLTVDALSQTPLIVRKGGDDVLLDVDGDGSVWIRSNLEMGGNSISFLNGCIACSENSMYFNVGEDSRAIRVGSDGIVEARCFLENGIPLRSIYASVLDKAQIKSELGQCLRKDDVRDMLTVEQANHLYIPRVREAELSTFSRSIKKMGTTIDKHVAEFRENHEWAQGAFKRCITTATALDTFVHASRNECIDKCMEAATHASNALKATLRKNDAMAMFAPKSMELVVNTSLTSAKWSSNMVQYMLPASRADDLFMPIQREADIEDAIDMAVWCSNTFPGLVTKRELPKLLVHASRDRDIDAAYGKAQWSSNAVAAVEGTTKSLMEEYKRWTNNTLSNFASNVEPLAVEISQLTTQGAAHSNALASMLTTKEATSLFLPVTCEESINIATEAAQWCSNAVADFVKWSDADGRYANAKSVERMQLDIDNVIKELTDMQDIVVWTSNAVMGSANPQVQQHDIDIKQYIESCVNGRLGGGASKASTKGVFKKRAGASQAAIEPGVNNFDILHTFADSSNTPVFEFRDALFNPPFISVSPTLGSKSKHGLGLWASHERGFISFNTGDQSGYPNEHMRLTPKGFLGIGTTTPKHELEVIGTANLEKIKEDGVYLDKKYVRRDDLNGYVTKGELEAFKDRVLNEAGEIVQKGSGVGTPEPTHPATSSLFANVDGLVRIPMPLSKIKAINGYTNTKRASVSEADLKRMMPEAFTWGGGVDAFAMIACLVEAVKELSDRLDAFEKMR